MQEVAGAAGTKEEAAVLRTERSGEETGQTFKEGHDGLAAGAEPQAPAPSPAFL